MKISFNPQNLLIDFSETGYEDMLIIFLENHPLNIDDFLKVGKCDSECPYCGIENFSVWNHKLGINSSNKELTLEPNPSDEILNLSIYLCNNCGKWTTHLE